MNRLSLDQVLKENKTRDPNSISSLKLTHRALSDVSCLGEFKNLERLDLSFNNLTSLEGLKSCFNLKWLSVAQNKLQSLKGIEGLSNLNVLNAGKNKITSMDEVKSIVSLRAVILNDNVIASICKLEQMKELNTLVLSKNPIRAIGDSLMKVKCITKLSLSHCQLQNIQSSLKSCVELKELRLAHNEIQGLPAELAFNKKLQNLDLGNNVITRWSDLKVLDSLANLTNLNLIGNPITEKDKLAKKIRKMLPNLHVFNARSIDKQTKSDKRDGVEAVDVTNQEVLVHSDGRDNLNNKKRHHVLNDDSTNPENTAGLEESKPKKQRKKGKLLREEIPLQEDDDTTKVEKKLDKPKVKKHQSELDIIDDPDTPFLDLFSEDRMVDVEHGDQNKVNDKARQDTDLLGGIVTFVSRKAKNRSKSSVLPILPVEEIGLGGPSAWDDDE